MPEFLFGYVAPGAKPKVIVFLDAETYGDKRPEGMVEMPGTEVTLAPLLGSNGLKEAVGQVFYGGGYRYAGTVILDGEECCPDRALEIAWARTQNLADVAWREGQRSTVPGDLFAVGRSLYVCAQDGFLSHHAHP